MSDRSPALPSVQDLCVTMPLYAEFQLAGTDRSYMHDLITGSFNIDCFCLSCKQPSVLFSSVRGNIDYDFALDDRVLVREFRCSRVHQHLTYFLFRVSGKVLSKIGQSPSMADLSEAELRPYAKVLSKDDYKEFTRAVGLASHGVGIGSFVYLRRIFERLIQEAHAEASTLPGWDESAFQQGRMDAKIELLKNFLPAFLVEQRKLYGILSVGVHSLSENACLEAFPVVRVGIELILDQKVAARKQAEKLEAAKKQLNALQQKLATKAQ